MMGIGRPPARARARRHPDERGFTLVGVLAAGTILSVVAVSLLRGWTVFDGLSFDLLLRQKAALVLNGEVERLWVVYTRTGFGSSDTSRADYPAITGLPNSGTRTSYASTSVTSGFVTSDAATFAAQATPDATVFLGSGSPPLNWVWLDRPRNLVARLSWRSCDLRQQNVSYCWTGSSSGSSSPTTCLGYAGSGTAPCAMLTAILEYPYAFNAGAPTAVGTTRTMTLSTIVGRRL